MGIILSTCRVREISDYARLGPRASHLEGESAREKGSGEKGGMRWGHIAQERGLALLECTILSGGALVKDLSFEECGGCDREILEGECRVISRCILCILESRGPLRSVTEGALSIGVAVAMSRAKVVDPSTEEMVPLGESGELLIRGYCVMLGYWDDLKKTSEVISPSRWYKTGDIASLNSLGYCRIEGRIKDLIIRGGENIYPAEIEQFLHTHPKVQEAQVIGVKDERLGEQVCACIKLKDGQASSVEEIRAFCKGQISHFKIPHYVMFVNSFPLTVSGKIKKNNLREEIEKKLDMKQKA
ncbi:unnamed protein product [Boreogadus saida]